MRKKSVLLLFPAVLASILCGCQSVGNDIVVETAKKKIHHKTVFLTYDDVAINEIDHNNRTEKNRYELNQDKLDFVCKVIDTLQKDKVIKCTSTLDLSAYKNQLQTETSKLLTSKDNEMNMDDTSLEEQSCYIEFLSEDKNAIIDAAKELEALGFNGLEKKTSYNFENNQDSSVFYRGIRVDSDYDVEVKKYGLYVDFGFYSLFDCENYQQENDYMMEQGFLVKQIYNEGAVGLAKYEMNPSKERVLGSNDIKKSKDEQEFIFNTIESGMYFDVETSKPIQLQFYISIEKTKGTVIDEDKMKKLTNVIHRFCNNEADSEKLAKAIVGFELDQGAYPLKIGDKTCTVECEKYNKTSGSVLVTIQ